MCDRAVVGSKTEMVLIMEDFVVKMEVGRLVEEGMEGEEVDLDKIPIT